MNLRVKQNAPCFNHRKKGGAGLNFLFQLSKIVAINMSVEAKQILKMPLNLMQ